MRWCVVCVAGMVMMAGCASHRSSLLLERRARGPLAESGEAGQDFQWALDPVTQAQEQRQVEVSVTFASTDYLKKFFSDRKVFGEFAGMNPYFPDNMVFYVRIANRSDQRIRITPPEFVLVDDRGNQYGPLDVDYITAMADYRAPMATTTRGLLEDARPGYFGLSVPVGKFVAAKPQGRFALIKLSSLQSGYLYPGVVHDGLIAFWSPAKEAATMRLLITNIKTDFDSNDLPKTALEFPFTFHVANR